MINLGNCKWYMKSRANDMWQYVQIFWDHSSLHLLSWHNLVTRTHFWSQMSSCGYHMIPLSMKNMWEKWIMSLKRQEGVELYGHYMPKQGIWTLFDGSGKFLFHLNQKNEKKRIRGLKVKCQSLIKWGRYYCRITCW